MTGEKSNKKGESLFERILSDEGDNGLGGKRPLVFSEKELLDKIEKLIPAWCDTFFVRQRQETSLKYDNDAIHGHGASVGIGDFSGHFSLTELADYLRKRMEVLIRAYK